jgi:hypothetical protein
MDFPPHYNYYGTELLVMQPTLDAVILCSRHWMEFPPHHEYYRTKRLVEGSV